MRKVLILFLMVTIICLVVVLRELRDIYSLDLESKGKDGIKQENRIIIAHKEIFGNLERPGVVFDHARHDKTFKKEGCNTCHPLNVGKNLIFEYPFKMVRRDKESVMNSYHEKCTGCHKKRIEEKKKAGPVACGDCHVKEAESLKVEYPVFDFDFYYHGRHVKNLRKDCKLCHHIYSRDFETLVYEEGTEQSCYYCHDNKKKRGPSLAVETRIISEKGLMMRKVSHSRCLNCHVYYNRKGLKAGPLVCSKCHTGKYRTVAELANTARPDRDQPKKPFIHIESGRMKGISFDHGFHEMNTRNCRVCHHETFRRCKECHGLAGSPEGRWVNTAGAYHDVFSEESCSGCHNIGKSKKDCSGCHCHLPDMDLQTSGPKKETCSLCHSGKKEGLIAGRAIPDSELGARKIPRKVTIKVLEKEYEPATFPHLKVVKKLVAISNGDKMATYFHRNIQTICEGCHHHRLAEAEAKKNTPPYCRSCHNISFDPLNLNRPRLLAAYHRQCMGCHEKMNLKPLGCNDCHKEKAGGR